MSRVLVIDDCDDFREIMGDLLTTAGHEVVLAAGPDEARKAWESQPFQIIMCDLVMPIDEDDSDNEDAGSAMVGVHAINEISKTFPGIPVIAISGKLTGEPLSAVSKFGAFAALSKPFSKDELNQVIERAIEHNKALGI